MVWFVLVLSLCPDTWHCSLQQLSIFLQIKVHFVVVWNPCPALIVTEDSVCGSSCKVLKQLKLIVLEQSAGIHFYGNQTHSSQFTGQWTLAQKFALSASVQLLQQQRRDQVTVSHIWLHACKQVTIFLLLGTLILHSFSGSYRKW